MTFIRFSEKRIKENQRRFNKDDLVKKCSQEKPVRKKGKQDSRGRGRIQERVQFCVKTHPDCSEVRNT